MKKTFIAIISAFLTLIVGCKEPTVESMTVTATAVGRPTGQLNAPPPHRRRQSRRIGGQ